MYKYQSNYFNELYYAIYLSNIYIKEKDVLNMKKDICQLFFNKYILNVKQPTYSSFIQIFFYINTIIYLSIGNVLNALNFEVSNKLSEYLKGHKLSQFLLLFVLLGLIVLFFGISIIIFFKFNKMIYKIIVSMFFIDTIHSKNDFMNKAENHFMKQLIKNYIQLLRNFNEENLTTL